MVDARIVRTQKALHIAIIELATSKVVPDITVSELANAAGINRVTFYKHYASPSAALSAALSLCLDPIRERFIAAYAQGSEDPATILLQSISEIVDHMEAHAALYTLSISTPADGTVPNLLADHFTETMRQYLVRRKDLTPTPPSYDCEIVARFFGTGLVGALKAWMLTGSKDRTQLLESVISLTPSWWFPEEA